MTRLMLALVIAVFVAPVPASAATDKPPEKRWGEIGVPKDSEPRRRKSRIAITELERGMIRDYYGRVGAATGKPLPPGLRKKNQLPPGWERKIQRGEVIPEAIWAQRQPLPIEILRKLPRQPQGVVTIRVEDRIARVVEATRVILDVFQL